LEPSLWAIWAIWPVQACRLCETYFAYNFWTKSGIDLKFGTQIALFGVNNIFKNGFIKLSSSPATWYNVFRLWCAVARQPIVTKQPNLLDT